MHQHDCTDYTVLLCRAKYLFNLLIFLFINVIAMNGHKKSRMLFF